MRRAASVAGGPATARVFITGGGGFLALHLAKRLVSAGDEVSLLVRTDAGRAAPAGAKAVQGDLVGGGRAALIPEGTEVVFHLAALSSARASIEDPTSTFKVNAMGTARLLEELRARGPALRRFVLASTAQVYGPPFGRPLDEGHPTLPRNPYAASKMAAETLALAYGALYGLPVSVLRFFNVYGPGQRATYVVPSVLLQCLHSDEVRMGNAWPVRDFVFVEDAVDCLRRAGTKPGARGEVFNVGTGKGVSIRAMVDLALKVTRRDLKRIEEGARKRPNDFDRLVANPGKAQRLLGWRPRVGLEEGLARTAQWIGSGGSPAHPP